MLHANASILEQKKAKVAAVAEEMKNAKSFIFVNFSGIPVEDDTKLRRELREAGVKYEVVKNSILTFALKEAGYEVLAENLAGCTAIAVHTCKGSDAAYYAEELSLIPALLRWEEQRS